MKYSENYLSNFKKSAELDKYCTFEYAVGTYRSTFEIAAGSDLADIKGNVKDHEDVNEIYKITTEFTIDLTLLTLNGKAVNFTRPETISTVAYIAKADMSFAPIYTEEHAEYCVTSVKSGKAEAYIVENTTTTSYNTDKYTKSLKCREYNINEQNIDGVAYETQKDTVKYDFRSAIDNAEFFFALRGLPLKEKDETTVPVVSTAYEKPTSLKITNTKTASANITLTYSADGGNTFTEITETVKYNTLEYRKDSTKAAGWAQSIDIQSKEAGNLPNYALPLKFAKPLIAYDSPSIMNMGSLVFTLNKVITNN